MGPGVLSVDILTGNITHERTQTLVSSLRLLSQNTTDQEADTIDICFS